MAVEKAAALAKAGNRLISTITGMIMLALVLVGGYMIWYTASLYGSSFLGDDLLTYKPSLTEDPGASLSELAALNPDVCAWITIDGTNIDYPVVQGEDNFVYLNRDVFGEFSLSGAIYLDVEDPKDFSGPYNLLYGHHMDNDAMFGQVLSFLEQDFFEAHPNGILFLSDKTYAISFFAAVETNAYDPAFLYGGKDKADMPALLQTAAETAAQYRTLTPAVTAEDKIIAMVTCENAYTDGRGVLLGRLDEIAYIEQGTEETSAEAVEEWFEEP